MKILIYLLLILLLFGVISNVGAVSEVDDHTAGEETEGKAIWEKFQNKELKCQDLSDDNFAALGEYFMGQMAGDTQRHTAMNEMMTRMMGEEGEKQAHIAMGKRISGCQSEAPVSQRMMNNSIMPTMMNMMTGNFGNNPMGWWGFGLGWIFMILFWVIIIVGVIVFIKWLINQSKSETKEKSSLAILKERYARGEIDKKEFLEKQNDLI